MRTTKICTVVLVLAFKGLGCASSPFYASENTTDSPGIVEWWRQTFSAPQASQRHLDPSSFQAQDVDFDPIQEAISRRDLTLGMSREQVRMSWGAPRSVDVAGHPAQGNERWVYGLGVSSLWSVQPQKRVYFERGRVVGWDTSN